MSKIQEIASQLRCAMVEAVDSTVDSMIASLKLTGYVSSCKLQGTEGGYLVYDCWYEYPRTAPAKDPEMPEGTRVADAEERTWLIEVDGLEVLAYITQFDGYYRVGAVAVL
jgi:hypothetical protein